jgi:hypothetical protein
MPTPVTPSILREIGFAVTTDVLNRKECIAIDRKAMPGLDLFWGKRKTDAGQAGGKTKVNLKVAGDQQLQGWTGLDRLGFAGNEIDLSMEFEFYNIHMGLQFTHTELLDQGYLIKYNEGRSKNFAKKNSADEMNRLADLFQEKVETHFDNFKVLMDRVLHYNTDASLPPGIFQYISTTPTIGTIGGKDRAANPLLQNIGGTLQGINLNALETVQGGNLYRGLTIAHRQANLYGRGRSARVDRLMAGSKFIDGYLLWRQRNNFTVNADSSKIGSVDIGIQDTEAKFRGLQIEWNPTLDYLDEIGTPDGGVPFANRCLGIASKSVETRCPPGMDLQISFPDDPPDQRFTRMSTDARLAPVVTLPNANFVVAVSNIGL